MAEQNEGKQSGYGGKRPFWQWVVLYLVIGGAVYTLVYYVFLANRGSYNSGTSTPSSTPTETPQSQPPTTPYQYPTQ